VYVIVSSIKFRIPMNETTACFSLLDCMKLNFYALSPFIPDRSVVKAIYLWSSQNNSFISTLTQFSWVFLIQISWFATKTISIPAETWIESHYFLSFICSINNLFLDEHDALCMTSQNVGSIVFQASGSYSVSLYNFRYWDTPATSFTPVGLSNTFVPLLWHQVFYITLASSLWRVVLVWFHGIVCMTKKEGYCCCLCLWVMYPCCSLQLNSW